MRAFLTALLLATVPLVALAPSATAKPYCTIAEHGCDGVVCYTPDDLCVGDPCLIYCAGAAPEAKCHTLYSGPFSRGDLCVDASDPKCALYTETWWFDEYEKRCYLLPDGTLPTSGCMHTLTGYGWDSYTCYDAFGPTDCKVWTETYWSETGWSGRQCFQPLGNPTAQCYDVYSEREVGPVKVVQRSSCHYEVYLFGEPLLTGA